MFLGNCFENAVSRALFRKRDSLTSAANSVSSVVMGLTWYSTTRSLIPSLLKGTLQKYPPTNLFSLHQVLHLCPWCVPRNLYLPRVVWGTLASYSAKKDVGWIWISPKSSGVRNLGVSCWGCLRPILLVAAKQFPA